MNGDRAATIWSSIVERAHLDATPTSIRHVCCACAATLSADGVAMVLASTVDTRELAFATDSLGEDLVELQTTYGEGPALDAAVGFEPVLLADLASAENASRWPGYAPAAVRAGARAQFSFPLRIGAVRVGALDLHRRTAGALTVAEVADAVVFAEAALAVVLDARAGLSSGWLPVEEDFLDRGAELHQAAGMVSVQLGVPVSDAMVRLRAHAYLRGERLSDVASAVVHRRLRFAHEGGRL
jgi:hypothetical protein